MQNRLTGYLGRFELKAYAIIAPLRDFITDDKNS